MWVLLAHVASSVMLVMVDRALFQTFEFRNVLFVATCHHVAASVTLQIARLCRCFVWRSAALQDTLPVAVALTGVVASQHLVLQRNAVFAFHVADALTLPLLAAAQARAFNAVLLPRQQFAAWFIAVSSIVSFANADLVSSLAGLVLACCYVTCSVAFLLLLRVKCITAQLSPAQMLAHVSPLTALFLAAASATQELAPARGAPATVLLADDFLVLLAVSCAVACVVFWTLFTIAVESSPASVAVVRLARLALTGAAGLFFFGDVVLFNRVLGVLGVLAGALLWTHSRLHSASEWALFDQSAKAAPQSARLADLPLP